MNERELEPKIFDQILAGEIGIDQLMAQIGHLVTKRTLQRRLDDLVKSGKVERIGKARATRYRAFAGQNRATQAISIREESPEYGTAPTQVGAEFRPLPGPGFADESKKLRDYLRDHYSLRKPCGYRREFLDAYEPNQTFYLAENLREHLRSISQSDDMAALPPGTYARQVLDRLIIDLSWNSSRLEGSTYSLLETDHLLAQGRSDDPARALEAQMVLNHK